MRRARGSVVPLVRSMAIALAVAGLTATCNQEGAVCPSGPDGLTLTFDGSFASDRGYDVDVANIGPDGAATSVMTCTIIAHLAAPAPLNMPMVTCQSDFHIYNGPLMVTLGTTKLKKVRVTIALEGATVGTQTFEPTYPNDGCAGRVSVTIP